MWVIKRETEEDRIYGRRGYGSMMIVSIKHKTISLGIKNDFWKRKRGPGIYLFHKFETFMKSPV